jgi:predicted amidophosphoribosyltransferase
MPEDDSGGYRICPNCGAKNEHSLSNCIECGSFLERQDSGEGKADAKAPEDGKGLFLCPNCGSFIMKGSTNCTNCGAQLDSADDISKKEISGEIKTAPKEESKPSLFMCPECGAFMSEQATTCPICGAEITEDEEESESEEGTDEGLGIDLEAGMDEDVPDAAGQKAETIICKSCMSEIPAGSERCLVCNTPVQGDDALSLEALEKLEELIEVIKCPLCGTELSKDATACYNCGTEFSGDKTEYVEEEIDKFFKHLDTLESRKQDKEYRSVAEEVETPKIEAKPLLPPKLKKPAAVAKTPAVRVRAAAVKPERKYELLFYATLMTLVIHYAGSQFGIDTIWFAAIILYGSFFVFCLILMLGMKELRAPTRKLLVQFSGFVLSASVPLRWLFTGPSTIDIPLLAAGAVVLVTGLILLEKRRTDSWATHMYLTCGLSLFFFSSLYAVGNLSVVTDIQSIAVWLVGVAFVLIGFVFMVYRKLFVPIVLRTEDIAPEDAGPEGIKAEKRLPRRVYDDEVPWYSKASALLLLDRYQEALECSEIAIKINSKNEIAWVIKGNAQSKLGNQLEALKSFNEAIKLNPSYEIAWNNKGNALARMKNYDEALRCYNEAIKLSPNYREAWVNKGYVLAKLGKYKDAAECAEKVISIAPKAKAETTASG